MRMFLAILLLGSLLGACGLKGSLHASEKHTAAIMFISPLFYQVV